MKKILLFSLILLASIFLLVSCNNIGETKGDATNEEVINDGATDDSVANDENGSLDGDSATHTHRGGDAVIENYLDSTCDSLGSFESVVYCLDCNDELSRKTILVDKKEHTEDDPRIENSLLPTCEEEGSFDLVVYCQDCGALLSTETNIVNAKGHLAADPVREEYFAPGCTSVGGYESVTYCSECSIVLDRISVELEALGHTADAAVHENSVLPTCVSDGGYDSVVYCTVCHDEISRQWEVISATGHLPNNAGDKCTACNQSLVEEEMLQFALSDDGTYYIITGIGTWKNPNLVIPSKHEGLPVCEIENYAFQGCSFIETITIPASITRIGYGAAMGCVNIKKVTFADKSGWQLMVGHDATSGTSVPSIFLYNTSSYKSYLYYITDGDEYWLVKV